jgi:hypothetical protein
VYGNIIFILTYFDLQNKFKIFVVSLATFGLICTGYRNDHDMLFLLPAFNCLSLSLDEPGVLKFYILSIVYSILWFLNASIVFFSSGLFFVIANMFNFLCYSIETIFFLWDVLSKGFYTLIHIYIKNKIKIKLK